MRRPSHNDTSQASGHGLLYTHLRGIIVPNKRQESNDILVLITSVTVYHDLKTYCFKQTYLTV